MADPRQDHEATLRCVNCDDPIVWHHVAMKHTHQGRSAWCDESDSGYLRPKAQAPQ